MDASLIPRPLHEAIGRGRASLFLGAGASLEAGFPSSQELANELARRAGSPHSETLNGAPLDEVAQFLYHRDGYGKAWVKKAIIEILHAHHSKAGHGASRAHNLMTRLHWRSIFTTNYDGLIEGAYATSEAAVQRCLPVYSPDIQIRKHEEEVVRTIKLNGSIDEAERNSHHQLVVTFEEQQIARSVNKEFYELLRSEAVNGPLVFVGFRFVHPGSTQPGTSPEFQELREILREMGPSAGYHYCVTPFDESDSRAVLAREVLKANRIILINAPFKEFMEAVVTEQAKPRVPLGQRPPIGIPVGSRTYHISPTDYELDKRHFEILSENVLSESPPPVRDSLDGLATWGSFRESHFITRTARAALDQLVRESIAKGRELIVLESPAGWGKTFLLKDLAIRSLREGRPVVWLNPHGTLEVQANGRDPIVLGSWDSKRISRLLSDIAGFAQKNGVPSDAVLPLIVADNAAERDREVAALYEDLSASSLKFLLIFAVRPKDVAESKGGYRAFAQARFFRPVEHTASGAELRDLLAFCRKNDIISIDSPLSEDKLLSRISDEEAQTSLIFALQVIFDKEHRPFTQIVQEYWENLRNDDARTVVLKTASLHRFGSSFTPRLYTLIATFALENHRDVLDAYRSCLDQRALFETDDDGEPCVSTLHSLVAEKFIKVSGVEPTVVDENLVGLVGRMTSSTRDLEVIRRLLKRVGDYKINLANEEKTEALFRAAADATREDWVVCQQFAKFLLQRDEHEAAFLWASKAANSNPLHGPLHHTKGNVLRKWGISLMDRGQASLAHQKFEEARQCFATSRVRHEPDEYGYVTHLDMLLYLIGKTTDEIEQANLRAEGAQLFTTGTQAVSQDRLNYLLDRRYQESFDLSGAAAERLSIRIEEAVSSGRSTSAAATYLARNFFHKGDVDRALEILAAQRGISDRGVLTWVAEAEINARLGKFGDAAKAIDSARRRRQTAENAEAVWQLDYWDLIISFAFSDYLGSRAATLRLIEGNYPSRARFPRGYFWRHTARQVPTQQRDLQTHGKLWRGRIIRSRAGDHYGQVEVRNAAGEAFTLEFIPKYFGRKDFRVGDPLEFVVTILPDKLRADWPGNKPFTSTTDDIYC